MKITIKFVKYHNSPILKEKHLGNLQKIKTNDKLVHKYITTYYSNKENQTLLFSRELTHKNIKCWHGGGVLR